MVFTEEDIVFHAFLAVEDVTHRLAIRDIWTFENFLEKGVKQVRKLLGEEKYGSRTISIDDRAFFDNHQDLFMRDRHGIVCVGKLDEPLIVYEGDYIAVMAARGAFREHVLRQMAESWCDTFDDLLSFCRSTSS